MSSQNPSEAELEAAMAALRAFNTEVFVLLALALGVTFLRVYLRLRAVGIKRLWLDDYLVVVAVLFYSLETALAYSVGNTARGLANNSMTDEEREALQPSDEEFQLRVLGSKIQLAGWSTYSFLLWLLKAAMCTFYFRLTKDLKGYRGRIYLGFVFIVLSWLVVMLNFFLSCRPFHHMWQIYPNPGIVCQPAISPALIWVYLSFNVATDAYLIAIPMPMLFSIEMSRFKRLWLVALFSCGLFVTIAAILRVVLLVSDPVNGAQLAGSWAVRETFVAVVTTNLPMLFPHFKGWVSPIITAIRSKISTSGQSAGVTTGPASLDDWKSKSRTSVHVSNNHTADAPQNESEEHVVGADLEILSQKASVARSDTLTSSSEAESPRIKYQIEVSVLSEMFESEDRRMSVRSGNYTSTWSSNTVDHKTPERTAYFADHIHQDMYTRCRADEP